MIVALHTGTPTCLLSVNSDGRWAEYDWEAGRQLARELLGRIESSVVQSGGAGLKDVTGIIAYEGPGSYTGLRIGLTVANTLSESLGVPIVGTSGDDWRAVGFDRLSAGENNRIVMPVYGGDPHITTPRK